MGREIKFSEAVREATEQVMSLDPSVYIMGLGVPDPKAMFGTTQGLQKKFGPSRVLDMPISENAVTGVAIGSALMGMRPIITHQRVDFVLLALDQIINNAAKWHYMFGGKKSIPLVIRLLIGRGWGQGPQHSQTMHNIFAHIPGLKVVMPSSCYDAKGLLVSAIEDNNPVIFIEHRWLHPIFGEVPSEIYRVPIGKARIVKEGKEITFISSSHMTLEGFRAAQLLESEGVSVELVDLRTIRPLDRETILTSVRKTGRAIVLDPDWKIGGFSSEIVSLIAEEAFHDLKSSPVRICYPDAPCPTSWALSNYYYPTSKDIAVKALEILGKPARSKALMEEILRQRMQKPMDTPDDTFKGPF